MRELHQIKPALETREEILLFGLHEIALMATGSHLNDPSYATRRRIKDYARRILNAAKETD